MIEDKTESLTVFRFMHTVVGAAVPVGLTRDAPDIGLFLYMSFENRFMPKKKE